jgi:group I intron endonuclease
MNLRLSKWFKVISQKLVQQDKMTEKDYTQGKVYMIINNTNGVIYVGSTTLPLYRRWEHHRLCTKITMKKDRPLYKAIAQDGADNFNIILIDTCPCDTDEVLRERETYFQRLYNCTHEEIGYNRIHAYLTDENRKQQNRDNNLRRREKHPNYDKEWREKNKEEKRRKATEQMRVWRSKNSEKYLENARKYREKKKQAKLQSQEQV